MSDTNTTSTQAPQIEGGQSDYQELQLVTFDVAGEEYGVEIHAVHEINRMIELTRVPQAPEAVEGVINLRGRIIPVVDIRKRFGLQVTDTTDASRIIVVEVGERVLGFLVDRVHEVLRINNSIVEPAPAMTSGVDADFISGVGKLEDRLIILLDLHKLFGDPAETELPANIAA